MSAQRGHRSTRFWCPNCNRPTPWGTHRLSTRHHWANATGTCHACGFTWNRKDDWKHFVVIRYFGSRDEFERRRERRKLRMVFPRHAAPPLTADPPVTR